MKKLYIFGNGFDGAHKINTSYSSFRKFLRENHEDFLLRFEAMYNIQPLDDTEPWYTEEAQKRWEGRVIKDLWETFESDIGFPNVDGMYDNAVSLVHLMPKEGIADTLNEYWFEEYSFAIKLQKYVLEWIETIDLSKSHSRKDDFSNNDYYITLNYTNTLERLYGINNVLHLHGGIPSCSIIEPIMGHGNQFLITSNREKARQCYEERCEWQYCIHKAIADFAQSLYKDTDEIIRRNNQFFSTISDVEEIIILGLSFGDVDIPYLEKILSEINLKTKWRVYYYTQEDKKRLEDVFGILRITRKYQVSFFHSDNFWDKY